MRRYISSTASARAAAGVLSTFSCSRAQALMKHQTRQRELLEREVLLHPVLQVFRDLALTADSFVVLRETR